MTYGSEDDNAEVRIPRHHSTEPNLPIEPASLSISSRQRSDISRDSINPPAVSDWYFFAVELQTSLNAGLPFVRAVTLVASGSQQRTIRRAGNLILKQLQGASGAKAIMQASAIPPLIRHVLVIGLRGGDAGGALRHVVSHYGWLLEIRGFILRIIMYPAMLVFLGTAVMIMRDTAIGTLSGKMSTSEAAVQATLRYGLPVVTGAAAAIIFAWMLYLPGIRAGYDRVILTAPVIGKMVSQYSQAVFFRVLALLIEAGMPITDGWLLAARVMPNEHLGRRLEPGLRFLQDGESLEEALRQTHIMDMESRSMAAIGEASGSTPDALRKYSAYRETELRSRVKMLTSLLGLPCMVIVALGYFQSPIWLAVLAFALVFIRRAI